MAHGTDKHNNIEENSEDKAKVRIPPSVISLGGSKIAPCSAVAEILRW